MPTKLMVQVRCTKMELERLKKTAAVNQQTVTDFVKTALNEAALDCSDFPIFRDLPSAS